MTIEHVETDQLVGRAERRTNLFVSAKLTWAKGFAPTTIRNLSASGALIEASVLPEPGALVQLSRGSVRIEARLIWCEGRRAGLKFGARIVVEDWLPSGSGLAQARVDQVVHGVKTGYPTSRFEVCSPKPATAARTCAEEIAELQVLLGIVVEGLADDGLVVAEHGEKLQMLDIARQRLARLSEHIDRFNTR